MKVLGTIRRGKVKIVSQKQMNYLEMTGLPHTHFVWKNGKLVRKVRHP